MDLSISIFLLIGRIGRRRKTLNNIFNSEHYWSLNATTATTKLSKSNYKTMTERLLPAEYACAFVCMTCKWFMLKVKRKMGKSERINILFFLELINYRNYSYSRCVLVRREGATT